jgi:hypothetical protein
MRSGGGVLCWTHVDAQVVVGVNLRGKEQQIARRFALVKGRPDGRDDGRRRRSGHEFPRRCDTRDQTTWNDDEDNDGPQEVLVMVTKLVTCTCRRHLSRRRQSHPVRLQTTISVRVLIQKKIKVETKGTKTSISATQDPAVRALGRIYQWANLKHAPSRLCCPLLHSSLPLT